MSNMENCAMCSLVRLTHYYQVNSLAFSPNGEDLASAYSRKIDIWSISSGERIKTLIGHIYSVNSVAFSPNK